jgi:hypothetical protein
LCQPQHCVAGKSEQRCQRITVCSTDYIDNRVAIVRSQPEQRVTVVIAAGQQGIAVIRNPLIKIQYCI